MLVLFEPIAIVIGGQVFHELEKRWLEK